MKDILSKLYYYGIIPVIKIEDADKAVPLAEALCGGGLPVAEVTFRTSCAKEAIKKMADAFPDMAVGAGTVLSTAQVDDAVGAGAKFIVSPGFNPKVVAYCMEKDIAITPGCANASDMEAAIEMGLDVVKFFPSENLGGIKMIKALAAPYGSLKFVPTGGINEDNLLDYLSFNKILACGGSYMVAEEYIKNGEFDKIKAAVRSSVYKMHGFCLKHIGFNHSDEAEANNAADQISSLFGFDAIAGNSSIFNGAFFEHMKYSGYGENGHIAIGVNFIDRAMFFLESKGVEFIEESKKYDGKGELNAVYLKNGIAKFAFHLVRNK